LIGCVCFKHELRYESVCHGYEPETRADRCFEGSQTGYALPLVSSSQDSYRATAAKTLPRRKPDFAPGENLCAASFHEAARLTKMSVRDLRR
jgi:hypothetical protein